MAIEPYSLNLINRTLVYGVLTATLALIYFGGVTTTQALSRILTRQEQQPRLAIVVSTLVISALFNPLRRRIQSFIDHRFYKRKYGSLPETSPTDRPTLFIHPRRETF